MAREKDLSDLFYEGLKDIYYAEKKIVRTLPKMAKGAEAGQLKQAFEQHREESQVHVERLEQVFEMIGKTARAKNCPAIDGILEEGSEIMEDFKGNPALDPGLVGAAQAVEHYEIARYGTLATWAQQLGMKDAAKLLQQTLEEEKKTDQLLSKIALAAVNKKAA
jgi:ferritin-like metal-binding protein YciE